MIVTPPMDVGSPTTTNSKLVVFISYSRQDIAFAEQLVAALDAFGFSTTIDRKGIHGAENWERRLGQLILESDTVVFVLTPASAVSPVCAWEVDHALALNKRIVPIVAEPLGETRPHERLRDLNYVHFYPEPADPGSGFGGGLARLSATLSVDVEWTREHTQLGALAARWETKQRPPDLLLRGSELARLQAWRDNRPANAPELTLLQRALLQASEDAEQLRSNAERLQLEERQRVLARAEVANQERADALQQLARRTRVALVTVSTLAMLTVAAAAIVYEQNQSLHAASLRLQEGMKLKIAHTQRSVVATEKWYRIATDYKLAIGIVSTKPGTPAGGTGFLVQGGGLRAEWNDQVVFLTAAHVVHDVGTDTSKIQIVFPGIDPHRRYGVDEILVMSPDADVAVLRVAGGLPRFAVPVDLAGQIEAKEALDGIAVLHWTGTGGFALGFGHGITSPDASAAGDRMAYTHVTGPGASGAPVFDANSGNVVCLHVAADPARAVGYCTSITKIVAAIR